ncbi:MAG TPA: R3H domain-containing nucleic acid-binding protein [Herpetosiphonaceae bacterium]|nr:R3H domain-containing nucleic acid-binding protein [Herpetosiphonaceae bacterium]
MKEQIVTSNIELLLDALPPHIRQPLELDPRRDDLVEVVMDLGRLPEARFRAEERFLSEMEVSREDLDFVIARIGAFGEDNRAGIPRTLHRISALRNRAGNVIGVTCRVGRAVFGTIDIIQDLVEEGQSMLLLGKPGVGKTTLLREVARVLADDFHKRVVIVDTSNEIAGDGDIPHPAIGRARRMQVARPAEQHAVMIEAVENHMPEVVVIDEIGTELEAQAARTIAERGVQLVGTAHGNTLENLMINPTLSDLIGGIQAVTLGDEEARRRGTQKTVLERKAPPTFDVLVEINKIDDMTVYRDVAAAVDALLRGDEPQPEHRWKDPDGQVQHEQHSPVGMSNDMVARNRRAPSMSRDRQRDGRGWDGRDGRNGQRERLQVPQDERGIERSEQFAVAPDEPKASRIFPFGVSRNRLEKAIERLHVPATLVRDIDDATIVMTLKNHYRQNPGRLQRAEEEGVPVYVLRSNTQGQMENMLADIFNLTPPPEGNKDPATAALLETEQAIERVINGAADAVELTPQSSYIRRLQHQLAERYNLTSESRGKEPNRRVKIFR